MGKPCSLDVGARIVVYVEAGHSARAAGRAFGVSASTAARLLAAWRESGPGDGPDAVPSGTWVLEVTSGRVVALDIPTGMVGQPLAAGEGLAVGVDAGGGALVAFDSGDGTMRWTRPPAGPPPARAVIAAGMVGLDPVGLPPDAPFEVLEADRGTPARPVHRGAFPPAWAAAIMDATLAVVPRHVPSSAALAQYLW